MQGQSLSLNADIVAAGGSSMPAWRGNERGDSPQRLYRAVESEGAYGEPIIAKHGDWPARRVVISRHGLSAGSAYHPVVTQEGISSPDRAKRLLVIPFYPGFWRRVWLWHMKSACYRRKICRVRENGYNIGIWFDWGLPRIAYRLYTAGASPALQEAVPAPFSLESIGDKGQVGNPDQPS